MNIIFNATCLRPPLTGIGHFSNEILHALENIDEVEISAFNMPSAVNMPSTVSHQLNKQKPKSNLRKIIGKIPFSRSLYSYLLKWNFKNSLKWSFKEFVVNQNNINVYFEPNYLLLSNQIPSIACVYDLSHIRFPEHHPKERVQILNKQLPSTIKKARAIVTISEFSKKEILACFDIDPAKIFVTYLGANQNFKPRTFEETQTTLKSFGLNYKKFILVVGTLEPRKNLRRVCEAYSLLPASLRDEYPLIIAGTPGWGKLEFSKNVEELIQNKKIKMLHYIQLDELQNLTSAATAACYVSLYEGFGMPILEAMQSGTPVITSKIGAMEEVAGDAALLANPNDIKDISEKMHLLLTSPNIQSDLSEKGLLRAQFFSWDKSASLVLKACDYALKNPVSKTRV